MLDAVAWLDTPKLVNISQFAGIDRRTAAKVLRNALQINLVDRYLGDTYSLTIAYPHRGTEEHKEAAVREALVRFSFLVSLRQFQKLGDSVETALRKAAAMHDVQNYDPKALAPLITWARHLNALDPNLDREVLIERAVEAKNQRRHDNADQRMVFLSHSSSDKPIIRKLATDLTAAGIDVWLDEKRLRVGDSIPDGVAQGLVESDFFLIALSKKSVDSDWVKKELNSALMKEVQRREVVVLPIKLEECSIPIMIQDKKYADFTTSYHSGLEELLNALKA